MLTLSCSLISSPPSASDTSSVVIAEGSSTFGRTPIFISAVLVYLPTGTLPPASAKLSASLKLSSPVTFVPLSFLVTTTTWLFTTFALVPSTTRPSDSSWSICFCAAEKKISHSYPSSICVRSVPELSALYVIFTFGCSSLYCAASSSITFFKLAAINTWISVSSSSLTLLSVASVFAVSSVFSSALDPHPAIENTITAAIIAAKILFFILSPPDRRLVHKNVVIIPVFSL